jgi:cytochrome c oxidase subunit 2
MGLVLLIVIWVITILSTYFFVAKTWWLPVGGAAAAPASSIWASERFRAADPGAVRVEVTSMQFAWYFRYPGPDGKFGATKPELEDASSGGEGALGLDPSDPASKDDVVTGTMFVPVNREVEVILRAHDVIHSLFIPAMRFKQDAVPGLAIHMHFTPTQTGDYEIACAELCGLGHYKMHGILKVVSQEEFDKWLAVREAEKQ